MSIQTYSGLPAHSHETINETNKLYSEFHSQLSHLYNDPDFERLLIPKLEDFMKFDVKNNCHPIHYTMNQHLAGREADQDEAAYLRAANHLSDEERQKRQQSLIVRELERQAVFDKSGDMKERLAREKNLLEEYIAIENAAKQAADIERTSGVSEEYRREGNGCEGDDHCDSATEGV
jgi:hypothetical protein